MKTHEEIPTVARTSGDISNENLQTLRTVFPQFVKDGQIDFDALKEFFAADGALAGSEKYGLSWAGKSKAFQAIRMLATGTLAPHKKESKEWDTTQNLFIEGDNLEVLKLLQRKYHGAIKMIYIDPPYNTGKDFIYTDNFTEYASDYYERTGQQEGGIKLTTNLESNGRYHSDWLTMMYPRLFLARQLLRDDGVIFVSIDDNEVANLRLIMDEIFGEENFVVEIVWEKRFTRSNNARLFANLTEKILVYRRSEDLQLLRDTRTDENDSIYSNPDNDPRGEWTSVSYVNPATKQQRPNLSYTIVNPTNGKEIVHPTNAWKYSYEVYERHSKENRLYWGQKGENTYPRLKRFLGEMDGGIVPVDLWNHEATGTTDQASKDLEDLMERKVFDFPKPIKLIQRMLRIVTDAESEDIILDFFAGSGTTAHAVMAQNAEDGGNRKWICVQLDEVTNEQSEAHKAGFKTIADIARERIRRAGAKVNKGDVGFKAFKLEKSNYRQWHYLTKESTLEEFKEQSQLFIDKPLIDGYREESVVYEIMLKEGLDLNATVTQETKEGIKLYRVTDIEAGVSAAASANEGRTLIITFVPSLTLDQIHALEIPTRKKDDTITFICPDNALDDSTKLTIVREYNVKVI